MNVSRNLIAGTIVTVLIVALLLVVFLGENARMEAEAKAHQGAFIARGARLYDRYCAGCHGKRGEGLAGVYPPLNVENMWAGGEDLTYYGTLHGYVSLRISAGHLSARMPAWSQEYGGPLRADQIKDLAQFVLNWQGPQPEGVRVEGVEARPSRPAVEAMPVGPGQPVADGDPDRGKQAFAQNCASCHGLDAAGGALGPSLVRADMAARPDEFFRETITKGRAGTAMPAWGPILGAQTIEDVIGWLRTRQ